MIVRLVVLFTACILGTTLASAPAVAKKSEKSTQQSESASAEDKSGGGDLDSILNQPATASPSKGKEEDNDASASASTEPVGKDKDATATGSSTEPEVMTTSAGMAEGPAPNGQGIGDKNPSTFQQQTPMTDVSTLDAEQRLLKGNVQDSTSINPLNKPMLPEMDCMGFAARVGASGTNMLKSSIMGKGNGYLTDGGAWSRSGDYPVMVNVFKGDSCEQQGIRAGDLIIELNGVNTYKLSNASIQNVFGCWDANMCNHYTLKRGSQIFRVVTRVTWHPFGKGNAEETLFKATMRKFAKQY